MKKDYQFKELKKDVEYYHECLMNYPQTSDQCETSCSTQNDKICGKATILHAKLKADATAKQKSKGMMLSRYEGKTIHLSNFRKIRTSIGIGMDQYIGI